MLAALMLRRARHLLRSLAAYGSAEAAGLEAALARLRLARIERHRLLRPYRRVWRWYRHPLAGAYRDSRRRRRAAP